MLDFDALVIGPAVATFGEGVTYAPALDSDYALAGGQPFGLTAVFDEAQRAIKFDEGAPVSTAHPELGVQLSQFPAGLAPQQDDRVTIRGEVYEVVDVQPDGHGHARLVLMLADDP